MYEQSLDYHRLYAAYEDYVIQNYFVVTIIHLFPPKICFSIVFSYYCDICNAGRYWNQ